VSGDDFLFGLVALTVAVSAIPIAAVAGRQGRNRYSAEEEQERIRRLTR